MNRWRCRTVKSPAFVMSQVHIFSANSLIISILFCIFRHNLNFKKMQKYRKKPVFIEAMQFTTNNEVGSPTMDKIVNWANQGKCECIAWHNGTDIYVKTQDGQSRAVVGDWIVEAENGVFYSCPPDAFEKAYELAD